MISGNGLILGASQGIGLSLVKQLLAESQVNRVYATYCHPESATELFSLQATYPDKLFCHQLDITEESQIVDFVKFLQQDIQQLHLGINCVGFLHDAIQQPEKSLKQINSDNLLRYFQINSIGAVLLAKHLLPLWKHGDRSVFVSISAKVGSIGDNHLGGWYGYRASKAALNMFMRTVAIEYARVSPRTIVITYHPGTTDTRLSRPFQKNVPPEKLFSPERTASQLLQLITKLEMPDSGQFFSWDSSKLPW
ncbi:SDR family NAD(P)-dependent oxidoreductase [Calothrix sp. 336/3]|uniref:SDR family NAD(P)-dependent oxidoreductase n=1 Tax=Calothrix sp. 336/3 TaxID=1337936 RepID=UPI0004E2C8AE|nr:SDR family NAD(P)-dependent oxidoreductase [Calothrix sp. 336/3]AKG23644.1 cell-cell signaling protein [Calothrix sp. 336/3]